MLTTSARLAALFALFALAAPVAAHAGGGGSPIDSTTAAPELFDTDRPDVTNGSSRLDPGVVQLETGWSRTSNGSFRSNSVGDALVRVGVSRAFELQVLTPGRESSADGEVHVKEWGEAGVGFKLGKTWRDGDRGIAAVASIATPVESHGTRLTDIQAVLAGDWTFAGTDASANLGIHRISGGGASSNDALASLSVGRGITGRVGAFLELALESTSEDSDAGSVWTKFADTGVSCAVAHHLQLDASAGRDLETEGPWTVGAGISKRW